MELELNDYVSLPIREKINLFLGMGCKNQELTDISGVNNSKIAHLKKYPESIDNLQMKNIEKIESAFLECVKIGKISLVKEYSVLNSFSLPKDKYLDKVINSITEFNIDDMQAIPMDKKAFEQEYKVKLENEWDLKHPDYCITMYNDTLSELYTYKYDFLIHMKEYPTSKTKLLIKIDLRLTKIPKRIK